MNNIYVYATHYDINGETGVSRRFIDMPAWEYRSLNTVVLDKSDLSTTAKGAKFVSGKACYNMTDFLFECDEVFIGGAWKHIENEDERLMSLKQQQEAINAIPAQYKSAIRSITFSGSKSYHVVIHTNYTATSDNDEAREIYKYLHAQLSKMLFAHADYKVDTAVAEPARLTRNANAVNYKTGRTQLQIYINENAQALDVNEIVTKYKQAKQEAEFFTMRQKQRREQKMMHSNYKADYHNLPSVRSVKQCTEGGRDNALSRALYAMKANGYADKIRDFIEEAREYVGDEIYNKFIHDARYR